jgi:hypothetical protein
MRTIGARHKVCAFVNLPPLNAKTAGKASGPSDATIPPHVLKAFTDPEKSALFLYFSFVFYYAVFVV